SKDGSTRRALISSNVLWNGGDFVHTRCFTRDVTESKQAEETFLEREPRVRLVVGSTPVMLSMAGADNVCNFFSKVGLDCTDRTMERELENGWAEGSHPEDFERCLEMYMEAFNDSREFETEYRLRRHDGQYRWILNHGAPRFNPDGTLAG